MLARVIIIEIFILVFVRPMRYAVVCPTIH
jgi:hypothetical protein